MPFTSLLVLQKIITRFPKFAPPFLYGLVYVARHVRGCHSLAETRVPCGIRRGGGMREEEGGGGRRREEEGGGRRREEEGGGGRMRRREEG